MSVCAKEQLVNLEQAHKNILMYNNNTPRQIKTRNIISKNGEQPCKKMSAEEHAREEVDFAPEQRTWKLRQFDISSHISHTKQQHVHIYILRRDKSCRSNNQLDGYHTVTFHHSIGHIHRTGQTVLSRVASGRRIES